MTDAIQLPPSFDWPLWIKRWDRMQAGYLVKRAERFTVIAYLIRETQPAAGLRVLDLGCGPGSLACHLLEALPQVEITGVDYDPTLLALAGAHLAKFGGRVNLIQANLREPNWVESLSAPFAAVVSATALHWLPPENLRALYGQVAQLLQAGGLFLNADHAGSDYPPIQKAWAARREAMRAEENQAAAGEGPVEDWNVFWEAYGQALGVNIAEIHRRMEGDDPFGPEEGMPLTWHLDTLRAQGFRLADCFWRCDCDAIYGGIR